MAQTVLLRGTSGVFRFHWVYLNRHARILPGRCLRPCQQPLHAHPLFPPGLAGWWHPLHPSYPVPQHIEPGWLLVFMLRGDQKPPHVHLALNFERQERLRGDQWPPHVHLASISQRPDLFPPPPPSANQKYKEILCISIFLNNSLYLSLLFPLLLLLLLL